MEKTVIIFGAKTLERFTVGILAKGFEAIGWRAEVSSNLAKLPSTTSASPLLLVQLHGAPHAKEDDRVLLDLLANIFKAPPSRLHLAVLLHRPDELPLIHPAFRATFDLSLSTAPPVPFRLVFMGDMHINDVCYQIGSNVTRHVIPHCFFALSSRFPLGLLAVGSFTTWGEMRSVRGVLRLLLCLFRQKSAFALPHPLVGYLGGRPAADIAPAKLCELCAEIDSSVPVTITEAKSLKSASELPKDINVILVDLDGAETLTPLFNTQMYHLGDAVRTGESSGSVHATCGIPVILEMNGSDIIENLRVIKVPYSSRASIESVDYAAGATAILKVMSDGSYEGMLRHNEAQSKHFNNAYSAAAYAALFV